MGSDGSLRTQRGYLVAVLLSVGWVSLLILRLGVESLVGRLLFSLLCDSLVALAILVVFFPPHVSADIVRETHDVDFIGRSGLPKLLGKWVVAHLIEVLGVDPTRLKVGVELRLVRVNSFSEFKIASIGGPKGVFFDLVPVNAFERVFL